MFEEFENLRCLDGKDQDNKSVESDDDEEDYGNESGEFDQDGNIQIPEDVLERLDPEIREKYKNGDISQAELLDFLNEDGGELGEEGEFEMAEEEGEAAVETGDDAAAYEEDDDEEES